MNSFNIEKQSMWKCITRNKLICNESDTLAIILPGLGYTLDKALLDYSKQLILDFKFDCLGIEYGFQVSREAFNRQDENDIRELLLETLDIIFSALELRKEIKENYNINIKNIYLTPINETFKEKLDKEGLIITGTKDTLISSENLEKIKSEGLRVLEIEDAGHSLCIKGNVLKSIKALEIIIENIKDYVERM